MSPSPCRSCGRPLNHASLPPCYGSELASGPGETSLRIMNN